MASSSKTLVVFAAALLGSALAVPHHNHSDGKLHKLFESWAARHGKVYTEAEEIRRFAVFEANAALVHDHANDGLGWSLELNEYADLTTDEFSARMGLIPTAAPTGNNLVNATMLGADDLPASVDWRDHNLVNPVQNQGSCGSCWAFSTIVSIEGAHAKATGDLVKLSEQNLVDCVKGQHDPSNGQSCCNGCRGGLMNDAMQYVIDKQNGGVDTEAAYGYHGVGGKCGFSSDAVGATISGFQQVSAGDETALMHAVARHGPVSIGVDASHGWQLYKKGVMHMKQGFHPFKPSCSSKANKMDHGVAIVGYGTTDDGEDYWIVRNSWGPHWGEQGYIRLGRGQNTCGVANAAVYPTGAN